MTSPNLKSDAPSPEAAARDPLLAARRGEEWAHREVNRHLQRFARYLCSRLPSGLGGAIDWQDVAQDANHRVLRAGLDQYRGRSPESYLFTITKSCVIQALRSLDRRRRREEATAHSVATGNSSSLAALEVLSILDRLEEGCRALLRRTFLEGSSYSELARERCITESSVRSQVSRCLRRARELSG